MDMKDGTMDSLQRNRKVTGRRHFLAFYYSNVKEVKVEKRDTFNKFYLT